MSDIFNMADTWNAGGTTFTAIKMNVTDTASAAGSLLMDLQVGGASKFNVRKDGRVGVADGTAAVVSIGRLSGETGFSFRNSTQIDVLHGGVATGSLSSTSWLTPTSLWIGASDTILTRDAANTLAQRNGTNGQQFNIYRTYTDASNYERLSIMNSPYGGGGFGIVLKKAGTGSDQTMYIGNDTVAGVIIRASNTSIWQFSASGHFLAQTDNTYDIGASGATRPRNVFVGGYIQVSGLPTADPAVAGRLWNDAGTVKVSAG